MILEHETPIPDDVILIQDENEFAQLWNRWVKQSAEKVMEIQEGAEHNAWFPGDIDLEGFIMKPFVARYRKTGGFRYGVEILGETERLFQNLTLETVFERRIENVVLYGFTRQPGSLPSKAEDFARRLYRAAHMS